MTEGRLDVSELMTKSKRRGWYPWLIGSVIAAIVIALIITAVVLLGGGSNSSSDATTAGVTLEDWLSGSLSTKSFNGTWLDGDEILFQDESGSLIIHNVSSRSSRTILSGTNAVLSASFAHSISPDRTYVLLAANYNKLYRHTYLALYTIVNLETLAETRIVDDSTSLQLAIWGPTGNSLIYVLQNNIFYRPVAEVATHYQLTTTGVFGSIYNGVPDWVYEEEVFSSNTALWFSPDGTKLVFGHFDDTETPIMNIPYYGYPGSLSFQYTTSIPIHYPKSGTTNPTVNLYYVDLDLAVTGNVTLVEILHPTQLDNVERILSAVDFPTNNLVSATWMNRVQNEAYIQLCQPAIGNCTTALSYVESSGWVEQFEAPKFSADGTAFLLILPQNQGDSGDWRHLVMVTNATTGNPSTTALTSGTYVVTEILSWDEANNLVYYLATADDDPAVQHLYRVNISVASAYTYECLSCNVRNSNDDTYCLYNSAKISTDNSHYVLTCAGPGVPEVSVYLKDSTLLDSWEDNSAVNQVVSSKKLPDVKRYTVPVNGGFNAQVRLLIPPNADLSGNTKYPMLVYVYGGPDSYQVTERFNVDWGSYLVTNKSIIYAAIDGRGSGLKGNSMLFSGYRNLGTVEIVDQINVTKHLQDNLDFIDSTRTAIWGWSYGGYATGMSLALDFDGVFKCGMSVAPVTDWALYDSIYTERFMGLPTVADNLGGYEQGQLLNKADNIKNKDYYLIHGTMDDNVHYQQSLMLAKVLEHKDILFRQQTYTDEDHGIALSRAHLYHSLEKFLDECFETSS